MRILVLSPRVAPGLLTLAAWDALRAASEVRATEVDSHVQAIIDAGIAVQSDAHSRPAAGGGGSSTVWIAPLGDVLWANRLADELMSGGGSGSGSGDVEVLFGSYELPGSSLLDVVDVMDRLRRECPWTSQQTHATLSKYLLEEAHETLEALDTGDSDHLREELGDLLMQIVFHARIAAEGEGWDIDDVAAGIAAKLIRRSPHVFGDASAVTADDVDAAWQQIKASEKQRTSVSEGIPTTLPALAYADKMIGRLGGVDVDPTATDIGSRLLALVAEARQSGVDAEEALRQTLRSYVSAPGAAPRG